jgi:hypothetical protein
MVFNCEVHVLDMGYTAEVGPGVDLYRAPLPREPFLPVPCCLADTQPQAYQFDPFTEVHMEVLGNALFLIS